MNFDSLLDSTLGPIEEHLFKITYLGRDGATESRIVKASDATAARLISGINPTRIQSIRRDWYREIDSRLPKSAPSMRVQARVMSVFAAQASAGQNPATTFDRLVQQYPAFRGAMAEVVAAPRVSDKLKLLRFDPQLQLLAQVGEESGMLGQVMGGASDEIIARQQMINSMRMKIYPALGLGIAGLLTMLIMPIFMVKPMEDIAGAQGLKITTNFCTTAMLILGKAFGYPATWIGLAIALVGLAVTLNWWWPYVKKIPGFSGIEAFFQVQHGYQFISAFVPLYSRGVSPQRAVGLQARFGRGRARQRLTTMEEFLTGGGTISQAFESDYWDAALRDCMRGFDTMKQESKLELLNRVKPLMADQMMQTANALSILLSGVGLILSVGITLIIFMGFTVPLMTMGTSIAN